MPSSLGVNNEIINVLEVPQNDYQYKKLFESQEKFKSNLNNFLNQLTLWH